MKITKILLSCFLSVLFFPNIFTVKYGSDSEVSVQPSVMFPSSDVDNEILAFGWFKNGFVLADQNTSCTFSSVFPVSGEIVLNGGSLYLNSNLCLSNITTLTAFGNIYGNGHAITVESGFECLASSDFITTFNNVDIALLSDLSIGTTIIFQGDCCVSGRSTRMALDPNIEILVDTNSTLTLKNLNIVGMHEHNIRCVDSTAKIVLDNVNISLASDFNFATGGLIIQDYAEFSGPYTVFFDSTRTLTISTSSTLALANGLTLAVGLNNSKLGNKPMFWQDASSEFFIENSNVLVGQSGLTLTRGLISISGKTILNALGTTSSTGFVLGSGVPEDDVSIRFYPAAQLDFGNSPLVYNLTDPDKFRSTSDYSKVIRGPQSLFYIEKNVIYSDCTIMVEPTSNLVVSPGKYVGYNNCTLEMPTTSFIITGARLNTYTSLLNGNCKIFLTSGVMPLYTLVQNSNNYILGNGDISGEIILYDNNAKLIFGLSGQMQNNITMSHSNLILSRNLEFSKNNSILGVGKVNLQSFTLILGNQYLNWTSPIYWDGDGGTIELNSDVYLLGTWTFSGNCVIKGNNNVLMLDPSASIVIERGSKVEFKDLNIYGLHDKNIECLDDAGTIALNDSTYILSNDYNFENGSLTVDNSVQIEGGPFTFAYKTKKQSIINAGGALCIGEYMTLSYEPQSNAKNLIKLDCPGSILSLYRATLHSTCTGIQLTAGVFEINGTCYISSDARCMAEGIVFGDGMSTQNDLSIKILDSSCLEITSGCVVTKNLD